MAQEYIAVKQKNDLGLIAVSKSVFQTIAQIEVEEEENVVLADATPFKNPLGCKITDDRLYLSVDIKVLYNANVNEICAKLQNKIYDSIKHMSEYAPDVIDIKVTGFLF